MRAIVLVTGKASETLPLFVNGILAGVGWPPA